MRLQELFACQRKLRGDSCRRTDAITGAAGADGPLLCATADSGAARTQPPSRRRVQIPNLANTHKRHIQLRKDVTFLCFWRLGRHRAALRLQQTLSPRRPAPQRPLCLVMGRPVFKIKQLFVGVRPVLLKVRRNRLTLAGCFS